MKTRIQFRRDTATRWTRADPVLAMGEPALETDTGRQKMGDGQTSWRKLAYTGAQLATDPALHSALRTAGRASALAGRLSDSYAGLPPLSADPPDLSWSATTTLPRAISALSPTVAQLGDRGTFNAKYARLEVNHYSGLDFFTDGSSVEFLVTENAANASRLWFFVDGQPISDVPLLGLRTAQGADYAVRLDFTAARRRRITVHAALLLAWREIRVETTTAVSPAPPLGRVAFVGDSFYGGNDFSPFLQAVSFTTARLLGVDCYDASAGGTGYVRADAGVPEGTFGSRSRVAAVKAFDPDLIVFCGSINDPTKGVPDAAAATYAAYAAALPGIKHIVFGVPPTNAETTTGPVVAANNAAIKTAAEASSATLAFVDEIGNARTGTPPPAFVSYTGYREGQLVTFEGSIYQYVQPGGNSGQTTPADAPNFALLTTAYTGTGRTGAEAGNGTRDVLLGGDNTHPTVAGALALATAQASSIRRVLADA